MAAVASMRKKFKEKRSSVLAQQPVTSNIFDNDTLHNSPEQIFKPPSYQPKQVNNGQVKSRNNQRPIFHTQKVEQSSQNMRNRSFEYQTSTAKNQQNQSSRNETYYAQIAKQAYDMQQKEKWPSQKVLQMISEPEKLRSSIKFVSSLLLKLSERYKSNNLCSKFKLLGPTNAR